MAFELIDRNGFLEMRMFGVLDGTSVRSEPRFEPFAHAGRVLVDTVGVTAITADVMWIAGLVTSAFGIGPIRTAVVATDDVIFGTFRQISAYRGEGPAGSAVEFFRDREEAERWLLLPG